MVKEDDWRIKHAEIHGEIQTALQHMDKNMDEMSIRIGKNTERIDKAVSDIIQRLDSFITFRTACREEMVKSIAELRTIATNEAKREAKKWSLITIIISVALGTAFGIVVTFVSHGMF